MPMPNLTLQSHESIHVELVDLVNLVVDAAEHAKHQQAYYYLEHARAPVCHVRLPSLRSFFPTQVFLFHGGAEGFCPKPDILEL